MFMDGVSFKFEDHNMQENIDFGTEEIALSPVSNEDSEVRTIEPLSLSDKRIFNLEIPKDIPGLVITPKKLGCHKMMYFLSNSKDIKMTLRKVFGNLVEVSLASNDHDVNTELLKNSFEADKGIDLNEKMAHMRYRFGNGGSMYLYMICPFLKSNGETTDGEKKYEFEFGFEIKDNSHYNENEASDYMKKYLNYKIQSSNSFSVIENPLDEKTLYEKVKEEIINAKTREQLEEVIKNLQTKYVNVFDTQLDITSIFKEDSIVVKKVRHSL
jgi:hypothetical protein